MGSIAVAVAHDERIGRRRATPPSRGQVLADLLLVLTWRDVKIKYKQSAMGLLWAILMPAIIVGAGVLVRVLMSEMSGTDVSMESIASISVKALPWAFFVSGIRFATTSLTSNASLVTKINCPRIAFPVSAVLSCLFDLAIAVVPLSIALAWMGVRPGITLLWVPALLCLMALLVTGMGMALAAGNLFFRDVKYIVEVGLTFAIFFTPVIYDVHMLGEWQIWVMLNPVAPLLEGLRDTVVLGVAPNPGWTLYSAVASLVTFCGGWYLFRSLEPSFADSI